MDDTNIEAAIQRLETCVALVRSFANAISERTVGTLPLLASVSGRKEGESIFVESRKQRFVFSKAAPLAPDMATCVQSPNGFWLFDASFAHPTWRTLVSDVFIDPVNGDDDNQGIYQTTPGIPKALKTAQEYARRWGRRNIFTSEPTTLETIIHIKGRIVPGVDRFDLEAIAGRDSFIRMLGESTALLHQGTLDVSGGFTPWNPTAANGGTATVIKDSSIASWAAWLGKRIFFSRVNSWAYILKDLGAGQARISVPQFVDEPNFFNVPVNTFPASGDAYAVEDPVHVSIGLLGVDSVVDISGTFGSGSDTNIADLTIETATNSRVFGVTTTAGAPMVFYRCLIEGSYANAPDAAQVIFSNCNAWGLVQESLAETTSVGGMSYYGGAMIRTDGFHVIAHALGGIGDSGALDYHTTIQGGYVFVHGGTQLRGFSVWDAVGDAFYNPLGHAVLLGIPGHHSTIGQIRIADRIFPIHGNGSAGVGLFIGQGTRCLWESKPNIYGALGQFKLGSGGKARFFNEATSLPSAVIAETWNNLTAAQPGGFGSAGDSNAHNYAEDVHLIQMVSA